MLEVQNLSMRFGGLLAVDEVSLDVQEHEIVSIIGPNGAGKTTVFNCMSGFYKPTGGKILFEGKEVQGAMGGGIIGVMTTPRNCIARDQNGVPYKVRCP